MSTGDWVLLASAVIGGGGISGFIGSLVAPLVRRPVVRAEATGLLTDAATGLVNELQEEVGRARAEATSARTEAQGARAEAREAGQEAAAARQTVRAMSSEMDELTYRLRQLIGWIHEPDMTLDQLRRLVPRPPGTTNGAAPRG